MDDTPWALLILFKHALRNSAIYLLVQCIHSQMRWSMGIYRLQLRSYLHRKQEEHYLAHGAFVGPSPGLPEGACPAGRGIVIGFLNGALEPGGCLDVVSVSGAKGPVPLAVAQGAAVPDTFGGGACEAVAHGACAPAPGAGAGAGLAWGIEEEWAVDGGGTTFGSRSQLKRDPKGKCWTTGNLDRTSALYILIIPCIALSYSIIEEIRRPVLTLLILAQPVLIPDMSYSIGLCSQKGPLLTS